MRRLDWTIVRTAATGGLLLLVPGALGAALALDEGSSAAWALVFVLVILFGFALAGFIAGRLRPDTPMVHGAASAFLAFVVAQLVGVVAGWADGVDISLAATVLTGVLAVTFGIAGALASDVVRRRMARASR